MNGHDKIDKIFDEILELAKDAERDRSLEPYLADVLQGLAAEIHEAAVATRQATQEYQEQRDEIQLLEKMYRQSGG